MNSLKSIPKKKINTTKKPSSDTESSLESDFSVHDSSSDNLINSDDDFAPKPSNSTKIPCAEKNTNIADSTPDKDNANRSFKDMGFLVTPEIKISATKRKPALNSRAQEVIKALFSGSSKKAPKKENTKLLGKQVQKSKNHKENEIIIVLEKVDYLMAKDPIIEPPTVVHNGHLQTTRVITVEAAPLDVDTPEMGTRISKKRKLPELQETVNEMLEQNEKHHQEEMKEKRRFNDLLEILINNLKK
ncbi:hypothetical protein FQA39_LY01032 [Lamprigera yunnana]|nr:hypothetical protein FQA39_LY01032 [Lamprigera yunnana]